MAGGKHYTNIEKVFTVGNQILRRFISDSGNDFITAARFFNPSRKVKLTGDQANPFKYVTKASGAAAHRLAFTYQFKVPSGGFTPPPGKKAFMMWKPEGTKPVFRARIYNKLGGQTITRVGFFNRALIAEINSLKGKRRTQAMQDKLAQQIANAVADDFANLVRGLPHFSVMVSHK